MLVSSQNNFDNIHPDKYHSERILKISHARDTILARVTIEPCLQMIYIIGTTDSHALRVF